MLNNQLDIKLNNILNNLECRLFLLEKEIEDLKQIYKPVNKIDAKTDVHKKTMYYNKINENIK